jgi:hypothetical protein
MDLTGYTDEELEALRHETAVEQANRLRLVQITQNIAGLTHELLDGGGTVQQAQDAVLDGQAAKEQADADTAAAEAERLRVEAERPTMTVAPDTIPPDGTTTAVVTYTDPGTEKTADVTFTVNGVAETVALDAQGVATLDVVSSTPNDTITVTTDTGLSVVITVGA